MKSRHLLIFGVAALLLGGAMFARAQQGTAESVHPWGTWVHQIQLVPGRTVPVLITANIDGTLTGATGVMFGGLNPNTAEAPIHGIWVRTGARSIGVTTLFFVFDGGVLSGFERTRASLTLSDDFQSYEGTEILETTPCGSPLTCPDPLDPATVWTSDPNMPEAGYPVSGKRLDFVPVAALNP